jgi:hypothetical protein
MILCTHSLEFSLQWWFPPWAVIGLAPEVHVAWTENPCTFENLGNSK